MLLSLGVTINKENHENTKTKDGLVNKCIINNTIEIAITSNNNCIKSTAMAALTKLFYAHLS
jgi:hypothetical protein